MTIFARPTVLAAPPNHILRLFGTVESGRAGELVDIQAKDCGQQFFRGVAGTTTGEGGRYEVEYTPLITTTVRAVSDGKASPAVKVQHLAMVGLTRLPRKGQVFRVGVSGKWTYWHKRVQVQQRRAGALDDDSIGAPDRFRSGTGGLRVLGLREALGTEGHPAPRRRAEVAGQAVLPRRDEPGRPGDSMTTSPGASATLRT